MLPHSVQSRHGVVGVLSAVSHVLGRTCTKACGRSGEGRGGAGGKLWSRFLVLLSSIMLGVTTSVGANAVGSGPSNMNTYVHAL